MGRYPGEDRFETFTGQATGAPVVAAAMVAGDQRAAIRQAVLEIVAEREFPGFQSISRQQGLMGDGAEYDDDFQPGHGGQLGLQVAVALANLGGGRLVGRGQATDGVGDAAIAQLHGWIGPIVRAERLGAAGETETVQGWVEQLAGHVAGEGAAGPVGPLFAGAQSDHEQLGVERAEGGNRPGMPVRIAPPNGGQVIGQPRAGRTVDGVVESGHGGDVSMAAMQLHWDIFCRVIDNYGDIGICWRLARQLAASHRREVRLWVDDLASLQPLCPAVDPRLARQTCLGVEILAWRDNVAVDRVGEVVIEAFACELPAAYLQKMALAEPRPCWINLEYLTAEAWAEDCHGMASPHPSLPLTKYFYFPGFSAASGGLLREAGLLAERDLWLTVQTPRESLEISLFCYDTAPVGGLLEALAMSSEPVICHVAAGKPLAAVSRILGGSGPWQVGKALVQPIPFMPIDDYDRLLWRCDVNFVRGEDSFVRAQWAGKPFVWQIYRQEESAHLIKLEAFLARYRAGLDEPLAGAIRGIFLAWNTGEGVCPAWAEFLALRPEIACHAGCWAERQAELPDLAANLVKFCAAKV